MLLKFKNQNVYAGSIALAGVVMFSAKSVFAKLVYAHKVDPVSVIYLRMLFALPLVAMIGFFYEKKNATERVYWKDVVQVILISLLGYYISSLLDFTGLLYVEAAIERLILFLYPTMVIFLSAIFLKKKIFIHQVIAIIVAYSGLVLSFSDKLFIKNPTQFWYGAILIILSSLTYAVFLVMSDDLIGRLGSVRFTNIALLTMSICIISHALFTGKAKIEGYDHSVYINCLLMAVLSTVIPVYMFNYAIEQMGSSNVSIISCAGPICTLMYSAVLLSEVISLYQIIGTLVVVGGIMIIYLWRKQEATITIK